MDMDELIEFIDELKELHENSLSEDTFGAVLVLKLIENGLFETKDIE